MEPITHDSKPAGNKNAVLGKKVGILSRVFGCHHQRMSRPVTKGDLTYQYCASCGIRRKYDLVSFKPEREFYYPASGENLYHV